MLNSTDTFLPRTKGFFGPTTYCVYLDQFATSELFGDTVNTHWNTIKDLLTKGVTSGKIICPIPPEHFIETSPIDESKALLINTEFHRLSKGIGIKPEYAITSQLISSLIRKNNITANTYVDKGLKPQLQSGHGAVKKLRGNRSMFIQMMNEATEAANKIREVERNKKSDEQTQTLLIKAHKNINVKSFVDRLDLLIQRNHLFIREIPFKVKSVPHWIDQIIYRLLNKHKLTKKELKIFIHHLKRNGFNQLPTLDIRTSLSAIIAVHNKKEAASDQIDIMRISSGLPISDILLTDKKRAYELECLGLSSKYKTRVFTGSKVDLIGLAALLESIVKSDSNR